MFFIELTLEDIIELVDESRNAFLAPASEPDLTTIALLQKFKTDPKFKIFGYKYSTSPVSYVVALSTNSTNAIAIGPMYVSRSFQGKGLGKKQVIEFIQYYKHLGYTSIFTKTWLRNQASRAIFESLGFKQVSVKNGDRADGDSTISYELVF